MPLLHYKPKVNGESHFMLRKNNKSQSKEIIQNKKSTEKVVFVATCLSPLP